MNKISAGFLKLRHAVAVLFIFAVVLAVPLFSLWQVGRFVHNNLHLWDSRSSKPLAAMHIRAVDAQKTPPKLFQEPLISVTFDDGYETTYTKAMPLLQKYGIHTTQYVLSGTENDQLYVSWAQVARIKDAGHEIACHTVNHPDLTTLDDEDLTFQLKTCRDEMNKHIGAVPDFASPYGAENPHTLDVIGKYFTSQRNTDGDPTNGVSDLDVNVAGNFNRMDIIGVTIRNDTTVDQLKQLVNYAKAHNGWVVLTYHQADDTGSKWSVSDQDFQKQFAYLSGTDVRIVTVQQALQSLDTKGSGN